MIPEAYWQILRRWFWIILGVAVLVGAFAFFVAAPVLASGSSTNNASVTLGVGRFLSINGPVSGATGGGEVGPLADYTTSVANLTQTPQFISAVQARLKARGIVMSDAVLSQKINVTEDRGLLTITISSSAASPEVAQVLVDETANTLIEMTASQEGRTRQVLEENIAKQKSELTAQLIEAYGQQREALNQVGAPALLASLRALAGSIATGGTVGDDATEQYRAILGSIADATSDPQLVLINSRVRALEEELADAAGVQENLNSEFLRLNKPVFVLTPTEVAPTSTESSLRKRDILVLGVAAGLVLGWLIANVAEAAWNRRQRRLASVESWETWDGSGTREVVQR